MKIYWKFSFPFSCENLWFPINFVFLLVFQWKWKINEPSGHHYHSRHSSILNFKYFCVYLSKKEEEEEFTRRGKFYEIVLNNFFILWQIVMKHSNQVPCLQSFFSPSLSPPIPLHSKSAVEWYDVLYVGWWWEEFLSHTNLTPPRHCYAPKMKKKTGW